MSKSALLYHVCLLTLHTAKAVGFLVRRPLHRDPEALMSDTISPSVTFRVPRGRDAVGRHGGPRRNDHRHHYTISGRPCAPAFEGPSRVCEKSATPTGSADVSSALASRGVGPPSPQGRRVAARPALIPPDALLRVGFFKRRAQRPVRAGPQGRSWSPSPRVSAPARPKNLPLRAPDAGADETSALPESTGAGETPAVPGLFTDPGRSVEAERPQALDEIASFTGRPLAHAPAPH